MAKAPEGILGPVIGKVGSVVGYILNGQYIVRALPHKRSGKKTVKEKSNTGKFAKVQAFLSPLSAFLKVGFKDYGTKTGGYKAAVSYALNHAVEGEYPNQFVNPELIRISGGNLHFPEFAEAVLEAENILRFNWSTENGTNGIRYDQAIILAYAYDHEHRMNSEYRGVITAAFRMTGTDTLQLLPSRTDREYHVYLGFVAQDRSCQAHSQYLGKVLIPKK